MIRLLHRLPNTKIVLRLGSFSSAVPAFIDDRPKQIVFAKVARSSSFVSEDPLLGQTICYTPCTA